MTTVDRPPTKIQQLTEIEISRMRQQDILDWLDGLITEAEEVGSPVVVVGTAVAKGVRQQIRDSLHVDP